MCHPGAVSKPIVQLHDPDDASILVTDSPLHSADKVSDFRASEAEAIVTDNSRDAEVKY